MTNDGDDDDRDKVHIHCGKLVQSHAHGSDDGVLLKSYDRMGFYLAFQWDGSVVQRWP